MIFFFTPNMFAAIPTQRSLFACSVSCRSFPTWISAFVAGSDGWPKKKTSLTICFTIYFLLYSNSYLSWPEIFLVITIRSNISCSSFIVLIFYYLIISVPHFRRFISCSSLNHKVTLSPTFLRNTTFPLVSVTLSVYPLTKKLPNNVRMMSKISQMIDLWMENTLHGEKNPWK